jgi:hypothetical protein
VISFGNARIGEADLYRGLSARKNERLRNGRFWRKAAIRTQTGSVTDKEKVEGPSVWNQARGGALDRRQMARKGRAWTGNRHSDKEKFCNDLNGPKTPIMSERPLKTLKDFPTSKLNTPRPLSQMATISECRYRWLRVPATTFVITHSPSRFNRRDGFSFSGERGASDGAGPTR